ncbi:(d)CMP kinase [Bacillus sp. FJAT-42376]|uniref:(d)CMP kinase n=1 Tax=Bacillus sp. FJAT-42376 TaxID=2014076 RepID=UPI000F4F7F84|nr:(d)CMP kinase [Bacillus sp. FJAT-42376]AZB43357.1 (d)CMP kinase [Bacillus sp. FJAT-42376]
MKKRLSVAIDGPAAAGKSTVAKQVAKDYSYIYIDTGAMYRALTLKAIRTGADPENEAGLMDLLHSMEISLVPDGSYQLVVVNGEDMTESIRTSEVSNQVSAVSMHRMVREEMVRRQQDMAKIGGVVMDGRDIGTHVLPDADVKVFLLASVEERAKRRHEENLRRGYDSDLEQLEKEIARRDKLDSEREVSPLKKADDAIEIDTTSLSIAEVVDRIKELMIERL